MDGSPVPYVPGRKGRLLFPLLALGVFFVAGCASTQPASPTRGEIAAVTSALYDAERAWSGTPHVLGGTSRRGVDCSALVQRIYADYLGLDLPRTTAAQVRKGTAVSPRDLVPGDLVFFRPTPKSRHVGIYMGDGAFLHASSSRGVTTSRLAETYWQQTFWTARRVLQPVPAHAVAPTPPRAQPPTSAPGRTGW